MVLATFNTRRNARADLLEPYETRWSRIFPWH